MAAYLIVALVFCGVWLLLNLFGLVVADAEFKVFCGANVVVTVLSVIGLAMGLR